MFKGGMWETEKSVGKNMAVFELLARVFGNLVKKS